MINHQLCHLCTIRSIASSAVSDLLNHCRLYREQSTRSSNNSAACEQIDEAPALSLATSPPPALLPAICLIIEPPCRLPTVWSTTRFVTCEQPDPVTSFAVSGPLNNRAALPLANNLIDSGQPSARLSGNSAPCEQLDQAPSWPHANDPVATSATCEQLGQYPALLPAKNPAISSGVSGPLDHLATLPHVNNLTTEQLCRRRLHPECLSSCQIQYIQARRCPVGSPSAVSIFKLVTKTPVAVAPAAVTIVAVILQEPDCSRSHERRDK
jgi:hypothetical protein